MKIPPRTIENFLQAPDPAIRAMLVYGPDNGLVRERVSLLKRHVLGEKKDPFRLSELQYAHVKEDPARLGDEIHALALTGGRRVVVVDECGASLAKPCQDILESAHSDTLVLFVAGELSPSSGLRRFFESSDCCAAIACYQDEGSGLKQLIHRQLQKNGFTADADTVIFLSESFAGDRRVILSELDKLITYMGTQTHIEYDQAASCITDSTEASLQAFCHQVASLHVPHCENALQRALEENLTPVALIRSLIHYFDRLYQVKLALSEGIAEQEAFKRLSPPIFFKYLALFKQHLANWSLAHLHYVLESLYKLEKQCKTTSAQAELLLAYFVMCIPRIHQKKIV